ncbi:mediator of RNA polymerase II transcription subunit 33A-like [Impatiens glandulifera]|uniref:mediator of RNA polymerase II transcription subunit 33A-like n=1 Tax=Impatiens glandulifera TaxID=253017 RepID=UPI001FB06C91|nr:mediator of RNA polymerase II transcription subunit 33A-like [Impatiens glandulifera]
MTVETKAEAITNGEPKPNMSTINEFQNLLLETMKGCEQRGEPVIVWTMEVAHCIDEAGLGFPSSDLGILIVSLLTDASNLHKPSLWKFLDQALSSSLVSRIHVLSLLTSRVIPKRNTQPQSYRLYLELLRIYGLVFDALGEESCGEILKSIDLALKLSQTYKTQVVELGHAIVLWLFSIVSALVDSILSDLGLHVTSKDGTSELIKGEDSGNMDIDFQDSEILQTNGHCENIRRLNWHVALDVLGQIIENKKAIVLLRLVHLNMPETFNGLIQKMNFLESHKLVSLKLESKQLFVRASTNIQRILNFEYELNKRKMVGMLTCIQSCYRIPSCYSGSGLSACWIPFDICMENAMNGRQFSVTSSIDVFAETIKTLQVLNCASWEETFLALWLSSLRLVQRERDPLEGPIPHLESRLCILLSITPLAIALVLKDDAVQCCQESDHTSRKNGLVSSLQILGQYTDLLCPPTSIVNAANSAASKATNFSYNAKTMKDDRGDSHIDTSLAAGGDMRHLIVEACIARKLLDTSAYFWCDYISASVTPSPNHLSLERSPWLEFMGGSPLTGPLVDELMEVPASSLEEIEKLHHVALNGSLEEKSAAAKIVCGASLSSGWNIQEHVVRLIVKLLSPPIPPNHTGVRSHLVDHMPVLSAILFGVSSVDTVHILSLHGMMPEVAAALTPICETYGSLVPQTSSHKTSLSNTSSIYMIFSSAFLLLLRLWKFYQPLLEQCIPGRGTIGGELTLEYLLILCDRRIQSDNSVTAGEKVGSDTKSHLDSYPKLRAWYCHNRLSVASTDSGLSTGNPVHQVANKILSTLYGKMTKTGTVSGDTSVSSGSLASSEEDVCEMPVLPAWDMLEAIPFVLEAILTACAHGRLSSRDLTTGLRDIVDFLPASLAAIISYFSAEITRGIWKPVDMDGIDWPSPAGNLASIDAEIKEILAAVGVNVPSCSFGGSLPAKLPLPMAALVSLTITFKLDKSLEYILAVTGPAMERCASACSWPSMPIVSSLWVQKVRRWHDFIVVSCSRSVFIKNQEPVSQLLRSCFTAFLGSYNSKQTGVNSLLGTYISSPGLYPRVSPGFLYLRTCRSIHNVQYINNVIIKLVVEFSRSLVANKGSPRLKSTEASFAIAAVKAREAAMLGSSLLCVSGGVQLVQELYQDSIVNWLLSSRDVHTGTVGRVIEGYAVACLMVFSGASIWGVMERAPSWSMSRNRLKFVSDHMDFVGSVVDGNVWIGRDMITWRAYVSCLVDLVVRFAPFWVMELKRETLVKLAKGLSGWGQLDLAILLLEKGGKKVMGSVVELVSTIS